MALPISYNVRNLRVRWHGDAARSPRHRARGGGVRRPRSRWPPGFRTGAAVHGPTENAIVVQRGADGRADVGHSRASGGQPHRRWTTASRATATASRWPRPRSWSSRTDAQGGRADINVAIRGVTLMAFKVRGGHQDPRGPGLPARPLRDRSSAQAARAMRRAWRSATSIRLQKKDWQVVGVFDVRGQRLRERDLGRRRGDGAGLRSQRRLSVADGAASRIRPRFDGVQRGARRPTRRSR